MIAEMQAESLPDIPPEILQTMMQATQDLVASGIDLPAFDGNDRFELPMPATYVVRADGTIAAGFVNEDYTKRMEPADIIQSLESTPDEGVS